MLRQVKLMLLANILLGTAFLVVNLVYAYAASVRPTMILWSPLWLTFYNAEAAARIGDLGAQRPNFGFYLFWALLLINVYFLIKLGRTNHLSQSG
jgi:hypothetical protein